MFCTPACHNRRCRKRVHIMRASWLGMYLIRISSRTRWLRSNVLVDTLVERDLRPFLWWKSNREETSCSKIARLLFKICIFFYWTIKFGWDFQTRTITITAFVCLIAVYPRISWLFLSPSNECGALITIFGFWLNAVIIVLSVGI